MPELPEVENFRRLLLPLVSETLALHIECPSENPPTRSFLSPDEIKSLDGNCHVKSVERKGKLICMVLDCIEKVQNQKCMYLFLHMGMTGRISTPSNIPSLVELKDEDVYPPRYTHLLFRTESHQAAFSDPRKFGSVVLSKTQEEFETLAVDALEFRDFEQFMGRSMGIKSLLLDQKRILSGVGNWVADEVLYQSQLHPEQQFLTHEQASLLQEKLSYVLNTAIACLDDGKEFPEDWLFHYRWQKRNRHAVKDCKGRTITFLKAAGRTSAIVSSIQKKKSQKGKHEPDKPANEPKKRKAVKLPAAESNKEQLRQRRSRRLRN